ncbi:MAG: TonB-dependent receptor [Candidatus Eremiobacteraeota bacterium]|nr:TonB-dependent receptor [Candidatus Eremiobacteraeota bacterium]
MSRLYAAIFAALACCMALPAIAATTGVVRGQVVVNNVPTAGVKLTLKGEGSLLTTASDNSGNYVFAQVPFGSYTLTASYRGVPNHSLQLDVASDQVLTINVALGALKVIANAAVTAHGGVSGTPVSVNNVGREQIAALPVNNSLNRIMETFPGIVRFSYNEPVAHGFHGVTYEIDGAPLPLATSSNFAEIIDPKNVDSMEVFTGAMPAEYGGSRQGAVVNIISNRASDLTVPFQSALSIGGGNFGQALSSFTSAAQTGKTQVFFIANAQSNIRGLDAPTVVAQHDNFSQTDTFIRTITNFNSQTSLAFDFSNQLAQFQIPINTNPANPTDPTFSVAGTDDVQREYDRFANLNLTMVSKDGNNIIQLIPWVRYTKIDYDGDLPRDVLGLTNLGACGSLSPVPSFCTNPSAPAYQSTIGLRQNRAASYVGIGASEFHAFKTHALKVGIDANREILNATETFACYDASCNTIVPSHPIAPPAHLAYNTTNQNQAGTQIGMYAEDKWTPNARFSANYGVRYDHSTGYVGGSWVGPRIGLNYLVDPKDVIHAYYGRFYAAPQLEDVRAACVVLQGCPTTPVYNLKPEWDAYAEFGIAHTFSPRVTGYVNQWIRNVNNVLDTTQLLNTPLFAVFNNTIGRAHGLELRLQGTTNVADSWFVSGTWSSSRAAGISGSTFLFSPSQLTSTGSLVSQLSPEDHDQQVAVNTAYTHRFGDRHAFYVTLEGEYGTGYPVSFENVLNGLPISFQGRLPTHLTANLSIGRDAGRNGDLTPGFSLDLLNVFNDRYIIKIANGFNTTQYAQGRSFLLRWTAPL